MTLSDVITPKRTMYTYTTVNYFHILHAIFSANGSVHFLNRGNDSSEKIKPNMQTIFLTSPFLWCHNVNIHSSLIGAGAAANYSLDSMLD